MRMINVGYSNYVSDTDIAMILDGESKPTKTRIADANKEGILYTACGSKQVKSLIVLKSGYLIKSPLTVATLARRVNGRAEEEA